MAGEKARKWAKEKSFPPSNREKSGEKEEREKEERRKEFCGIEVAKFSSCWNNSKFETDETIMREY